MPNIDIIAAVIFALALLHTFATKFFESLAHRRTRHAGLFHLLGEVEVVFGAWSFVLIGTMALVSGAKNALDYAESRQYTEPLFVFVVMVVAASRPVLYAIGAVLAWIAQWSSLPRPVTQAWLGLSLLPLLGSLITEPAAMTVAALMLAPLVFRPGIPESLKYGALGVLFVNISIGGTLSSFAAPPVLMVSAAWGWDNAFMLTHFGWRAAIAVVCNATAVVTLLYPHLTRAEAELVASGEIRTPPLVIAIHLGFLAAIVALGHHPVMFLGAFMMFLGFTHAYPDYQRPLILREGLLVGFFLAGLVVLGGMQQWWLQPIVSGLKPTALFFGALGLTALTDNAALTYLGSLIDGISESAQFLLVAGAVAGGGLTVIANAPNPAGVTLLKQGFQDESIGAGGLLLGALAPTALAAALFLV